MWPPCGGGEQERRVEPRREGSSAASARAVSGTRRRTLRLRVRGQDAVGEAALDDDGAACAVDVAALERDPLVRP